MIENSMITYAIGFSVVQNETLVTGAHKTTKRISTVAILTNVLVLLAFVNVLQNDSLLIGFVPGTTGA